MSVTAALERIRDYARAHEIPPATLARLAGLHKNALRDMYRPDWSPLVDTLRKVEQAIERHEAEQMQPEAGAA